MILVCSALLLLASSAPAQPPGSYPCAKLVLTLPSADSMEATLPEARCGPVRLVIARAPQLRVQQGYYSPQRVFTLEVAIENLGDTGIRAPIRIRADSMSLLRYGRTLGAGFARPYGEVGFWDGHGRRQPWLLPASAAGRTALAPAERSTAATITLVTDPLATGFVLWLWVDGVPRPADPGGARAVRDAAPPEARLGRAARRLIDAAAFPLRREVRVLYSDQDRELQFFGATYGQGQDCPGGCFYSRALGISTGSRSGWLRVDNYEASPALALRLKAATFAMTADDDYLVSEELADALAGTERRTGYSLDPVMRALSIASPRIPRARLARLVESTYTADRDGLLGELLNAPSVRGDPELLTLLAFLPRGYDVERIAAEQLLVANARAIVADPATSTRTLFVLVRGGIQSTDTALARAIAEHPNGRRSTGVLALLAARSAAFDDELLATVEAAPDLKATLGHYITQFRSGRDTTSAGLLRDPRTTDNLGILSLLAQIGRQEVRWAACRRLPEDALLCYDDFPARAIR